MPTALEHLNECRAKRHCYTSRELDFLGSAAGLVRFGVELSPKQAQWLEELAGREVIDFDAVNKAAVRNLLAICRRWLPNGKLHVNEYVALNPTRADGKPGSFRINVQTGKWADFADPAARGGDPISLAAYLHCGGDQIAGAIALKGMLGA